MAGLAEYRRHLRRCATWTHCFGRLLDRLKHQGLYDQSLIVVTGDHGVSFRLGGPSRDSMARRLPDIMSVPLFIKLPGQHGGRIDDRNAQTIDIVPTISDLLDADLSWEAVGALAVGVRPRQVHEDDLSPRSDRSGDDRSGEKLAELRDAAVKRKNAIFGRPNPDR